MATSFSEASDAQPILVINSGSSSLKFGVYQTRNRDEQLVLNGIAENIARPDGKIQLKDASGHTLLEEKRSFPSSTEALRAVRRHLEHLSALHPVAIGHRIVHGGPKLRSHRRITPDVLRILEESIHFAPLHIPPAVALIHQTESLYPELPQFACFDTAFHNTLPEAACHYPLPEELWQAGVLRYGFHGLSYEAIVSILGSELRPRTVVAHLGNGCSLAALRDGISVDTSMGLTPTGGIPMSSRSGDLDPGIVIYLLRNGKLDADKLEELLNKGSGLAGLSGGQSDLRSLQSAAAKSDLRAALAIEIFCREIGKTIASYAAVLGGIDLLVFTAGIGENSPQVRALATKNLAFLGIALDDEANQRNRGLISTAGSTCEVRVIATDEDRQIARHSRRLLAGT